MIAVLANALLNSLLFAGHQAWHQRSEGMTPELGCLGVNPAVSAQLCDLGPVTQRLCASVKQNRSQQPLPLSIGLIMENTQMAVWRVEVPVNIHIMTMRMRMMDMESTVGSEQSVCVG